MQQLWMLLNTCAGPGAAAATAAATAEMHWSDAAAQGADHISGVGVSHMEALTRVRVPGQCTGQFEPQGPGLLALDLKGRDNKVERVFHAQRYGYHPNQQYK